MPRFKANELTPQQQSFIDALLSDASFNVTKAAERSGYSTPNKSGWRLMRKPAIQAAIGKARKERSDRTKIEVDDVLTFLRGALIQNPLALFKPGQNGEWTVKSLHEIPKEYGPFIEAVSIKSGEVSIRLVSKSRALEACMKHLGLYRPIQVQTEQKLSFDWDKLYGKDTEESPIDKILREAEAGIFPGDPAEVREQRLQEPEEDDVPEAHQSDLLSILNSEDE